MTRNSLQRNINLPVGSTLSASDYQQFIVKAFDLMAALPNYFAPQEDINALELAHLIPPVPETVLAIYVGINDAVCNKGLVTPFLPRHGHNNVFVFDSQVYAGGAAVPAGTVDAQDILPGFEPPNKTWDRDWTYVMIEDPARTFDSLWREKGYIDMIPAKFEDFTMLSAGTESRVCTFIDPAAFAHPVNQSRPYLRTARQRGEAQAGEFVIPEGLKGETEGLVPVILERGEKLYVATPHFGPCAHCWSNIHPKNKTWAVVNENSAVPLDLVISKPPLAARYAGRLVPPKGSADLTTDWFYRGQQIVRQPLLQGLFKG